MTRQKEACDSLISVKNKLVNEYIGELKNKDDEYVKELKRQSEEIGKNYKIFLAAYKVKKYRFYTRKNGDPISYAKSQHVG